MNVPKLRLHEKVEVRQLEEGLQGSWHPGIVVGVSDLCREVEYNELLCESGNSKLIESIPVTGAIDGQYQRPCVKFNFRGRIRPIPHRKKRKKLSFGVCVDVWYEEAWWEGVIFDFEEGSKERRVFFPDEGDESVFKLTDLRLTSDWDEFTGQWRERGVWILVSLFKDHKKYGDLCQFIRRAWIRLKSHYGFRKMISEWTCGTHSVWKEYFKEVIYDMTTKPVKKNTLHSSAVKKKKCTSKKSQNTTSQNDCSPINPRKSGNTLNISKSNNLRWKKKKLPENKSRSRKLMPAILPVHKLEGEVFGDNNFINKRRELTVIKQKKSGVTHRKEGRIRINRRNGLKKRSPKRIKNKKVHPTKFQDLSVNFIHTFPKELEASKTESNECCENEGVQNSQHTLNGLIKQKGKKGRSRDSVCLVCQYGGELLYCDLCLSAYHLTCIDLEEVPAGGSFCPSCKCGICGMEHSIDDDQLFTQICYQCSRRYHVACVSKSGTTVPEDSILDTFCSKNCFEICARLHELLQISNPTALEGFNWTITRSRRNVCNVHNERIHPLVQVSQVLSVFRECFEPIAEPHTSRDLVADIVYNSGSKLRRLDFHGFNVMTLVHGEELVCAATIRIHGQKVAEMPLIATRFKYRRKGMCRLLLDELEKMLVEMGVERLVLPGIAQLSDTWVSSFGFEEMSTLLRKELLGYPFVLFQGTSMFHKVLTRSTTSDTLQEASSLEQHEPAFVQVSNVDYNCEKRFSLQYKRRGKSEAPSKTKVSDGLDRSQCTYKCVYKRRRIQANRDSLDSPTVTTRVLNVH